MKTGLQPTPVTDRLVACLEGFAPPENPYHRVCKEFGCAYITAKKMLHCWTYRAEEWQLAAILEERSLLKN
ncbi:hypothetical protein Hena1_01860 [Erwinia phage Hena1]|jgi:hypothetical protein|uniref:Uncharacterized protein n=1 Tax=Erwinia phage Hena1 TaxID=2678601 RepID=A0A6B9JBC5_9CAUD|nr:hypothetical protein HWC84_gp178 [Erwinia phage Hena1]QGZ16336.1 hypothetical protein Hena1_01860 [Erwinia phage Hena1]